jgi:hypothetical protein
VTLLTDASSAVSAQVMPDGANGIVKPEVGDPEDLLLDFIQKGKKIRKGTTVVTSGFTSSKVESLFPRGIPIGKVVKAEPGEIELYQRVHIKPFADLRRLDFVQVLTAKAPGERAEAGALVLTAVGYGVGRYSEVRNPAHGLIPIPVAAAATGAWVVAFAAVSFMLEIDAPVSALVLRDMIVTVFLNTLIALPVFALVRRVLRPVLVQDPNERRRRRRSPQPRSGPIGLRGLEI